MSTDNDFEKLERLEDAVSSTSRGGSGDSKPEGSSEVKSEGLRGFDSGFWQKSAKELVYWRDIKKSAVVFASGFLLLLSFALFSLVSIVSYVSLIALSISVSFVVYKKVLQAVQKTPDGHPFKEYLEKDVSPPVDKIHEWADIATDHLNNVLRELRRLFLVEDVVDTLKMALLLWVMTYIGDWFNGMTLIILAFVGAFTVPKFYETFQVQIDNYIGIVKARVAETYDLLKDKVPFLKKAAEKAEKTE